MSKPLAFSLTVMAAIVLMTAIVFVAVLTRDSDGIEVKFDAMNATFEVDCISPWEDEGGPVPFADGEWGDTFPPESTNDRYMAWILELEVAELVEGSPGPEVAVGIMCNSGGTHSTFEVQVFAGNSSEATRLGRVLHGQLEWTGGRWSSLVQTSQRLWIPSDSHCCPSKFVRTNHEWRDDRWVETSSEVWVKESETSGS